MRRRIRIKKKISWRFYLINSVFALMIFVLTGYLFTVQVQNHKLFSVRAESQASFNQFIQPNRGEIYIRSVDKLFPVAINKNFSSVYAVPKEIPDIKKTSEALSKILAMDYDLISERLSKANDPYEPIKDKLSDEEILSLKQESLKGIYLTEKAGRYYPGKELLSQVIGFTSANSDDFEYAGGRYGIELEYEKLLSGKTGFFEGVKDALGNVLGVFGLENQSQDGVSLVLTIDKNIQEISQQSLKKTFEKWKPKRAEAIVMDPKTGKILAAVALPDFNLNDYSHVKDLGIFRDPAVEDIYEPGSVIKPFTMAAAIDSGKITPKDTFTDTGEVIIGSHRIQNYDRKVYGKVDMTKILEQSINTGAVFLWKQVGDETIKHYFQSFGLGAKTGIDLPNEIPGNISNLEKPNGRPINFATASFGQGISVSTIGLLRAYSAIANGGKLIKPYIVDEIIYPDGKTQKNEPQIIGQVISPETSETVVRMLVSVVDNGHGRRTKIDQYSIAGKTGTAQVVENGVYSDKIIVSFVGFFPAYDPQFLIFVSLREPQGLNPASLVAVPVFKDIATFLINYYNVPPDRNLITNY